MLTELVTEYLYAETKAERRKAERDCRRLGIGKTELKMMAASLLEDSGHPASELKGVM